MFPSAVELMMKSMFLSSGVQIHCSTGMSGDIRFVPLPQGEDEFIGPRVYAMGWVGGLQWHQHDFCGSIRLRPCGLKTMQKQKMVYSISGKRTYTLFTSLPLKKARSSIGAPVVLRATGPLVKLTPPPPWMPPPASLQPSEELRTKVNPPPPWKVPPPRCAVVYGDGGSEVHWPVGPNLYFYLRPHLLLLCLIWLVFFERHINLKSRSVMCVCVWGEGLWKKCLSDKRWISVIWKTKQKKKTATRIPQNITICNMIYLI